MAVSTIPDYQHQIDEVASKIQGDVKVIRIDGADLSALMNVDGYSFCFMVTRVSTSSAYVACLNRYNGTINVKEVYNSGSFSTVTNSAGTVSIRYSGSNMGVYGVGFLKP